MVRLLRAVLHSWNGLREAARTESAFVQELVVIAVAVPLAFLIAAESIQSVRRSPAALHHASASSSVK